MNNYGSITVSSNIPPGSSGVVAENGLSYVDVSGVRVILLGNDEGDAGEPAQFFNNREIANKGFYLKFVTATNDVCGLWFTDNTDLSYSPNTQMVLEGSITTKKQIESSDSGSINVHINGNSNWLFVAIGGIE